MESAAPGAAVSSAVLLLSLSLRLLLRLLPKLLLVLLSLHLLVLVLLWRLLLPLLLLLPVRYGNDITWALTSIIPRIQVLDQILSVSDWAEALEKGMRIAGYISCVLCVLIACVVVFLLCNSVKGELLLVRKSKGMPVP